MTRLNIHLAGALSAAIAAGSLFATATPANAMVVCNPRAGVCWHVRHRYWNRPWLVYHGEGWDNPNWRWRGGGYHHHRHRHWRRWRHHWRRY